MAAIRTRMATAGDRATLIAFIRDHWAQQHVFVTAPEVFDWQYGQADGRINMMLAERLEDDGEASILGVLGFIPGGRFDAALGDEDIMLALWKVREDIAPPGLGLQLLKAIRAQLKPRMIGAIGISDMVKPIYAALGYRLDKMLHAAIMNPKFSGRWRLAQAVPDIAIAAPGAPACHEMRLLDPEADREVVNVLAASGSPEKSWSYVSERYLKHPWYEYDLRLVCREGQPKALVIWRRVEAEGTAILRIVDMIGDPDWLAEATPLLRPIMTESQVEYIDIMGCGLDVQTLKRGGFVSPAWNENLVLPNYFAPFEPRNIDIHLSWKRFDAPMDSNISAPRLFRADSDQDRPNQPPRGRRQS